MKKVVEKFIDELLEKRLSIKEAIGTLVGMSKPLIELLEHRKPARSESYIAYIKEFSCLVCNSPIVSAHHHGSHGMSEKTDDYRCLPLCHKHHMELHRTGELKGFDEMSFLKLQMEYLIYYARSLDRIMYKR